MPHQPPVEVKICGIRKASDLKVALDAGADFIGFVFVPDTPRYITPQDAAELLGNFSETIRPQGRKIVAVMVDPDDQQVAEVLRTVTPDILQLHGNESRERVREIGSLYDIRIMKALPVASQDDIQKGEEYVGYADMLLFDAKSPDGHNGGTGKTFDWDLLGGINIPLPWFLSGGLTVKNVQEAIRRTGTARIDVSSGVERERGVKDETLIAEFIKAAKTSQRRGA